MRLRNGVSLMLVAALSALVLRLLLAPSQLQPPVTRANAALSEAPSAGAIASADEEASTSRVDARVAVGEKIRITVLDDSIGSCIEGAKVWHSPNFCRHLSVEQVIAVTGDEGQAEFEPGPGYWGVYADGYIGCMLRLDHVLGANATVRLRKGGKMEVLAVDSLGQPIPGLHLSASRTQVADDVGSSPERHLVSEATLPFADDTGALYSVTTEELGTATFGGLSQGVYDVRLAGGQNWIRVPRKDEPALRVSNGGTVSRELRFAKMVGCAVRFQGDAVLHAELAGVVPSTDLGETPMMVAAAKLRLASAAPAGVQVFVTLEGPRPDASGSLVYCTESTGWGLAEVRLAPLDRVFDDVVLVRLPGGPSNVGQVTVHVTDANGRKWEDVPLECIAEAPGSMLESLPWSLEDGRPSRLPKGNYVITSSDPCIRACLEARGAKFAVRSCESTEATIGLGKALSRLTVKVAFGERSPSYYTMILQDVEGRHLAMWASVPNGRPLWVPDGELLQAFVRVFGYRSETVQLVGKGANVEIELPLTVEER